MGGRGSEEGWGVKEVRKDGGQGSEGSRQSCRTRR